MYRCDYCDGFAVISATVSLRPSSFKGNFNDTVTLITTIHFTPEHVPAWNVSLWLLWRYRWGQVYFNTIPTIPSHWSQWTRHNSQNDTFHAGTEFPTCEYVQCISNGETSLVLSHWYVIKHFSTFCLPSTVRYHQSTVSYDTILYTSLQLPVFNIYHGLNSENSILRNGPCLNRT